MGGRASSGGGGREGHVGEGVSLLLRVPQVSSFGPPPGLDRDTPRSGRTGGAAGHLSEQLPADGAVSSTDRWLPGGGEGMRGRLRPYAEVEAAGGARPRGWQKDPRPLEAWTGSVHGGGGWWPV